MNPIFIYHSVGGCQSSSVTRSRSVWICRFPNQNQNIWSYCFTNLIHSYCFLLHYLWWWGFPLIYWLNYFFVCSISQINTDSLSVLITSLYNVYDGMKKTWTQCAQVWLYCGFSLIRTAAKCFTQWQIYTVHATQSMSNMVQFPLGSWRGNTLNSVYQHKCFMIIVELVQKHRQYIFTRENVWINP